MEQESVARQVRMAEKVFPQNPVVLVTVLTIVIVTLVPLVGGVKFHGVPHSTIWLGAQCKVAIKLLTNVMV